MNELGPANAFLVAQLRADVFLLEQLTHTANGNTVVSLRRGAIPKPAAGLNPYPAVMISFMSGNDSIGVGGVRVLCKPLFLVKAISSVGYDDITDIADRVDGALHQARADVTVNGAEYSVTCLREKPFERDEFFNGVQFFERGGFYRLMIQAAR